MIAIIDYGMGNLRSVLKAFESFGAKAQITQNKDVIASSSKIVLPGVGAIQPAMEKLSHLGLIDEIKKSIAEGKAFLGICLGFQLLFESSDEGGAGKGMGILRGSVIKFTDLKVPHIGWNQCMLNTESCPLFLGIENLNHFYFCHSYYVKPTESSIIMTQTEYGVKFASSVQSQNIFGVQFHPEKSQSVGLKMLKNFTEVNP